MSAFIRQHYSRAPIAEAIIDIRISNPDAVPLELLSKIADELAGDYPTRLPIRHVQFGMEASNAQGNSHFFNSESHAGWRLASKNQDRVLQLQRIGFTYSHLPPYSNWDNFRNGARESWNRLKKTLSDQKVSRVAVRVINKIPAPSSEGFLIADYLNVFANLPATLPTQIEGSFLQIHVGLPDVFPGVRAILNVGTGQVDQSGHHILLDIDIALERLVESDEETWSIIEKFGIEKDNIFEACITDKTRDLIR